MPVLDGFSLHLRDAVQHMPHVAGQAAGEDEGDGPVAEEGGEVEADHGKDWAGSVPAPGWLKLCWADWRNLRIFADVPANRHATAGNVTAVPRRVRAAQIYIRRTAATNIPRSAGQTRAGNCQPNQPVQRSAVAPASRPDKPTPIRPDPPDRF